jgi:hypothetical protein
MNNTEDEINKDDQIITIKLPRSQAEILRTMIKREETYSNITATMKSSWIWVVAAGVITLFSLWDTIKAFMIGVK